MSKIVDGTPVDAATTNAALLGRTTDDTATGKITLNNSDVASGGQIDSIQKELNSLDSFAGQSPNQVYNNKPTYTNNQGFSANEDLRTRTDNVSAKFNNSTGHTHDGTSGNGGPVAASSIASVELKGVLISRTFPDSSNCSIRSATPRTSTRY